MRPPRDLLGERVLLTGFREEHAHSYVTWLADPYIQRMAGEQAESRQQVLDRHRAWSDSTTFLEAIILDRETRAPIGDVSLDFSHGDPRFGIMIGEPSCRRRGYAAEAFELMARLAREMGARLIVAEVYDWNEGSMRFHERMGFRRVRHDDALHEWVYELELGDRPGSSLATGMDRRCPA